jgi:hypothetical protein
LSITTAKKKRDEYEKATAATAKKKSYDCHLCGHNFKNNQGLQYHIEKQVCVCKKTKVEAKAVVAEANCHLCGHNFKSLQYHIKKQVCVHKNKKAEAKAATQKRINNRKLAVAAARGRKELERLEAVTEKAKATAAAAAGETTTTTKKNQRQENSSGRSKWE